MKQALLYNDPLSTYIIFENKCLLKEQDVVLPISFYDGKK